MKYSGTEDILQLQDKKITKYFNLSSKTLKHDLKPGINDTMAKNFLSS